MTQYFHVDESGDPGIRSLKGVPYFVLAVVQLPDLCQSGCRFVAG